MPRTETGTFLPLQEIVVPGGAELSDALNISIEEIVGVKQGDGSLLGGGAAYDGSFLDEVASLVNTTLTECNCRPNGDHLAGRNIESELLAGREQLIQFRDNPEADADLRAATIPAIVKIEQQISRRDFMRPIRDPEWGADIMELVFRCAPHPFERLVLNPETGVEIWVSQMVSIKLETLSAEIDEYGEICVWKYEES